VRAVRHAENGSSQNARNTTTDVVTDDDGSDLVDVMGVDDLSDLSDLETALAELEGDCGGPVYPADRQRAEAQLRDLLVADQLTGPRWARFQEEVVAYGLGVLRRWAATGELFDRAAARRRAVPRPTRPLSYDEQQGLVDLVVAFGFNFFRDRGLRDGGWRAERGAALRTYFINACLLQFKAAFTVWRMDTPAVETQCEHLDEIAPWIPASCEQPSDQAVLHSLTWDLVRTADVTTQKILVYFASGMTYAEAAAAVGEGMTAAAAKERVRRFRRAVQRSAQTDGEGSR
jgi:hypothetical protein